MRRFVILCSAASLLTLGWGVPASAGEKEAKAEKDKHATLDSPAPAFTLPDVAGKPHSLADYKGKYVVLEWTNFDCPFVKKHYRTGNMQNLQKQFAKKGVVWFRICSSAPGKQGYYLAADIQKRLEKEKSMHTAYLIDADGKVGKMYSAKTTPHMYIIDPKGVLIYAGGIDDKPSTSTADIKGATNFVNECLEAALAGQSINVKSSTPYGCAVKYKDS